MHSALNGKLVTVFGASGFLGRHVVLALARRGYRIRAAVRRPDLAEHLQPQGGVGQIMPVQANLRYRWSVDRAVEGADAVVNLVGILYQSGRQSFDAVQGFGPRAIAEAARAAGLNGIVHVSAIGADAASPAAYARSKAAGEAGVLETLPDSVILRPSIVFGPEDDFFNRFAAMARMSPVLPLVGGGGTKFQPVYVGDVAAAVAKAVDGGCKPGTVYELGGPEVKSFKECLELMLEITRRKRLLLPLPFGAAEMQARVLQLLPKPLLTVDQVKMLRVDNVVSAAAEAEGRTLAGLGINPSSLAAILPSYLTRFREHGQYDAHRVA
ncbi:MULTISPECIES: complex I NDUFA9 subunit family protein [unclassified Pannonibacter]|uniref:complex I NDUFA9 subunit family protein n=1 Tax=unclassified Pannonibacter TaxID=2627228 RepID=UPI001648D4BD|nr:MULTISPECIES: complex I NDUFA9 subunit family protein [unclassified Pannonibacter]